MEIIKKVVKRVKRDKDNSYRGKVERQKSLMLD